MKITLCGSQRFAGLFDEYNAKLTLLGHCVYALAIPQEHFTDDQQDKVILDLAHLLKILNSDTIVVLNKDGYIGSSTTREIWWARMLGKQICWLEQPRTILPHSMLVADLIAPLNYYRDVQTPDPEEDTRGKPSAKA
jgi:hypothetical protein